MTVQQTVYPTNAQQAIAQAKMLFKAVADLDKLYGDWASTQVSVLKICYALVYPRRKVWSDRRHIEALSDDKVMDKFNAILDTKKLQAEAQTALCEALIANIEKYVGEDTNPYRRWATNQTRVLVRDYTSDRSLWQVRQRMNDKIALLEKYGYTGFMQVTENDTSGSRTWYTCRLHSNCPQHIYMLIRLQEAIALFGELSVLSVLSITDVRTIINASK